MRTTLDIDDDVLALAKQLAQGRNQSTGKLVSNLLRLVLQTKEEAPLMRNGFRLFPVPPDGLPITLAEVNRLRDEE